MKEQEVKINKRVLKKSFWNWFFFQLGCMNFETIQGPGFTQSMVPIAEALYPNDKKKQSEMLKRHVHFYNIEPHVGSVVNGMAASFEEGVANGKISPEIVRTTKVGLMGPIAGIGDAIIQGMILPLLLSIGISLSYGPSNTGSLIGPLFYIFTFLPVAIGLSYWLYMKGYELGFSSVEIIMGPHIKKITTSLNILALVIIGGISASYISVETPIKIGGMALQSQLDNVFPKVLSLLTVIFCYSLLKFPKVTTLKLMSLLLVVSITFSYLGIL